MAQLWRISTGFSACIIVAAIAACSGGATPPAAMQSRTEPSTLSYSQNGSSLTITGPITAIESSTQFTINAGSGCGYLHVNTSSSTAWSPSGAKAVVGENATAAGTGSCATSLTASSVKINSTPAPTATPVPTPNATQTPFPASITIGAGGKPFGLDDYFNPADGDTSSGGQGSTVDGVVPCATSMPNTYHAHAFVGIIAYGRQYALPDGAGMVTPGGDITYAGFTNWTEYASKCYYYMHTHDATGVIHIESSQSVALSTSIYTLGNFFDVWGQPLSSTRVGPFSGTVTAYVAQVPLKHPQIVASDFTLFSGNPATIPLKSHTTVWLEVGSPVYTPSHLPVLNYWEEY